GPTETTIDATFFRCERESRRASVPIGRPISNKRIYLLDSHLQPVPIGVVGQLYVGGAGLARGYVESPGLTAERFVPDPFSEGGAPGVSELRALLKERVPEYMIPSAFVMIESLPRTPGGKVDRQALAALNAASPERVEGYVPARTPVEEVLCGIWAGVLDVERVGIHDDFFELGGHSLLATQVVARVREAFAVAIPLRRMFESATVAALAATIEGLMR